MTKFPVMWPQFERYTPHVTSFGQRCNFQICLKSLDCLFTFFEKMSRLVLLFMSPMYLKPAGEALFILNKVTQVWWGHLWCYTWSGQQQFSCIVARGNRLSECCDMIGQFWTLYAAVTGSCHVALFCACVKRPTVWTDPPVRECN